MTSHRGARALFLLPLLLAPTAGCLEEPTGVGADDKEEALRFSLAVVETYFTQDVDAFRGMLSETLYTLEGDGPMVQADLEASFLGERPFPAGRDYSNLTMDDYLATYAPRMLTWDEAVAMYPEAADLTWSDGWAPDEDDLVFFGSELNEGKSDIVWTDLLAFLVSRETGEWRLKAFSG